MTTKEASEKQSKQQTDAKKESGHQSLNLAIIGGAVGAGVGLLATSEASKDALKNLGESEFVKMAGREFRKTAHEVLAKQAQSSLQQLAEGYLHKLDGGQAAPAQNEEPAGDESQSDKYEEIKEENKNLNDRLQRIEDMLNNLVSSK